MNTLLRWLKNILVLAFILVLPLAVKFYFADPAERAFYLSWLKQQWHRPVAESVTQVVAEVKQAAPEPLIPKYKASVEGFQQLANCGKTQTLAVTEETGGSIYRWVDDQGRVHFSDKEPGALVNSQRMSVHYQNKKRYFNLEIIEDTSSLPAFTRDKVSADVRQIYGILSRDMALDHLRRVLLNVRIIESQDAFQAYRAKLAPQISTNSGFYIGKENEAVVFQGNNDELMLAVVRHEATHVIVAGLYGYSPVWFNEGLAEYFEQMQLSGQLRQVQPVGYHLEHLRRLAGGGDLPGLREYVQLNPEQWYGGNLQDHYAIAWSLVYFLMSDENGKALLREMMNRLAENYCWQFSSAEYIDRTYPGGLTMLERHWREWLQREPAPHRY